jgi:uncharacterized protein (DUF2384 family)
VTESDIGSGPLRWCAKKRTAWRRYGQRLLPDDNKPTDLLTNPMGFEPVDEFLNRLEYGVYQ